MPVLEIRPFMPADVPAASHLVAARHARDRGRLPVLDSSFTSPTACEQTVAVLAGNRHALGAVALREGRPVGFLLGQKSLVSPEEYAAQFTPPDTASVPILGHAVGPEEDATTVYRALYAELARAWVADGFFTHHVELSPGDREAEEAWVSLAFGRAMTAATRPVAIPVRFEAPAAGIEVHQAGPEDVEVVMALSISLARHHARSPMFWPVLPLTFAAQREVVVAALDRDDCPHFIAYRDGVALGLTSLLGEMGFSPRIINRERDVYLWEGVVEEEARGLGVGAMLLEQAIGWARARGYQTCTLHFASDNASGAPFWLGHGFVPIEHTMVRRVDPRIAWAHP